MTEDEMVLTMNGKVYKNWKEAVSFLAEKHMSLNKVAEVLTDKVLALELELKELRTELDCYAQLRNDADSDIPKAYEADGSKPANICYCTKCEHWHEETPSP